MKKNKLFLIKKNQQHEQEDVETIQEIQEALTKIDNHYSVFTPDLQSFEQMVIAEQQRQKRRFFKELLAFSIVALLIISGLVTAFFKVPTAFLLIQGIATLSLPIFAYVQHRKRVSSL